MRYRIDTLSLRRIGREHGIYLGASPLRLYTIFSMEEIHLEPLVHEMAHHLVGIFGAGTTAHERRTNRQLPAPSFDFTYDTVREQYIGADPQKSDIEEMCTSAVTYRVLKKVVSRRNHFTLRYRIDAAMLRNLSVYGRGKPSTLNAFIRKRSLTFFVDLIVDHLLETGVLVRPQGMLPVCSSTSSGSA